MILAATRLDGGTRGCSDNENDDNNNNENDYNNNENDYNDDNNQNDDAALGGRKSAQMQEQENREQGWSTGLIRPGSLGGDTAVLFPPFFVPLLAWRST